MIEVSRVFDLLAYSKVYHQKEDMVAMKEKGVWRKYSTDEFIANCNAVSLGLLELGIKKGDKVAIMSPNRPEWNFTDFGIMQIGATQVPLYPTLSEQDLRYILNDAEVKVIFAASADLVAKIALVRKDIPSLIAVYSFDELSGTPCWTELKSLGKGRSETEIVALQQQVGPDDLLTLIYTSGTTGTPKGVMLTHNNLVSNFLACKSIVPQGANKALSFLPMSHIFERMVVYLYFSLGMAVYYAESLDTIAANLQEVKPQMFTTVPRLLEKVYDRIVAKGSELTGIKRKLFFWSLDLGLRYEYTGNGWWYYVQLAIANVLIFPKWREALGGNVKGITSGGAALQPRLARIFTAAKLPVYQGYGLTETSPVTTVNRPGDNVFGSSGSVIAHVEIKFASDGEILVKGPNVMKGYYKRPDATAEAIDAEGWFHTGDIGVLDHGKYLRITDRKKEIFKTAGGKYIAPQVMENKYKESPLIEQIMVIGENQRFPAALIVPTFAALKEWCEKKGITYTNNEEMIKHVSVLDKFNREIERYNADFGHWEQVKKIALLPREFSIDAGEMTPKMSLKRKAILERYAQLVDQIYA